MMKRRIWMAAVIVTYASALAQGPGLGPGRFGPGRGFGGAGSVVTGQPFADAATSTSVEKLADGATITHSSTSTEARDPQGRTVRTVTNSAGGASGTTFTRTTVTDPVASTVTTWESQTKVAIVMHLADAPSGRGPGGPGPGGWAPGGQGPDGAKGDGLGPEGRGDRRHGTVTREVLAGKTIAGVYATGVKTTRIIPAGTEGNDKALVSVREVWTSPDLKIVVLETSDDPRDGSHKMEVTSLSTANPDSTLFQVPSGYAVREQTRHHGE